MIELTEQRNGETADSIMAPAGEAIDPFRLTSKALGHKNITSTDSYLSFMEADIDDAILAS